MYRSLLLIPLAMLLAACAAGGPEVPDTLQLQRDAARAYQAQQWKQAEEGYARLVVLMPGEPMLWFRLGNVYAHTHQPDKAIAAYREAVIRDPGMKKAWHNMSVMSLRKTTHLFIEMIKHLEPDDPLYAKSVATAEALIRVMKQRQESTEVLQSMAPTVPEPRPEAPPHVEEAPE